MEGLPSGRELGVNVPQPQVSTLHGHPGFPASLPLPELESNLYSAGFERQVERGLSLSLEDLRCMYRGDIRKKQHKQVFPRDSATRIPRVNSATVKVVQNLTRTSPVFSQLVGKMGLCSLPSGAWL